MYYGNIDKRYLYQKCDVEDHEKIPKTLGTPRAVIFPVVVRVITTVPTLRPRVVRGVAFVTLVHSGELLGVPKFSNFSMLLVFKVGN